MDASCNCCITKNNFIQRCCFDAMCIFNTFPSPEIIGQYLHPNCDITRDITLACLAANNLPELLLLHLIRRGRNWVGNEIDPRTSEVLAAVHNPLKNGNAHDNGERNDAIVYSPKS